MSQTIPVSVTMDEKSFHDFAVFDLFRHQQRWRRPAIFALILLVFAGICASQIGTREGAALLAVVLAVVALGVPGIWFWTFFHNLKVQIRRMGLTTPKPFYRLELGAEGLEVWMAGQQEKPEPTHRYPWGEMWGAYRTHGAIYLYVKQNQAYLLPGGTDAVWGFLSGKLDAARLHDCR